MTENEAIKILKRDLSIQIENKSLPDGIMAIETAIKALEKVQEYEKLGTVEELKEAKHIKAIYEQIKWERDIAIAQLNEIDVELGRKMDDIKMLIKKNEPKKPIIHGLGQRYCPVCKCGGADHFYCARCGQKLG